MVVLQLELQLPAHADAIDQARWQGVVRQREMILGERPGAMVPPIKIG